MSSLFVGNLSSHVRHREFENAFRRFGRCSLELKEGYGFVVFEDHHDAKQALEALQGKSISGEQPSLSWAKKRKPFQRFPAAKGNFAGREGYPSKRRPLVEVDKKLEEGRRVENLDEVRDGLTASEARDEPTIHTERDADWTDMGPEKSIFNEDMRYADPLDIGRWDPRMEGSPDMTLVEKLLEDEQHLLDVKNKEYGGSVHERSQGSSRDRHHDRFPRLFTNAVDQYKRVQETNGRRQVERCYNCGKSGHVKWQCRFGLRRINVQSREGLYDVRRNDFRNAGNRIGFRGIGDNGRFRGPNASRRMFVRDVQSSYERKSSRRLDPNIDRTRSGGVDKTHEKSRHRRHRSESPRDSSSRGRSQKRHKRSSKRSKLSKKQQRRSSGSPLSPRSVSCSSSRSRSHLGSKSASPKSGSQLSNAGSRSQSSNSRSSKSQSLSASSSRSRSRSAQSGGSDSKSRSKSLLSNSPMSHDISSRSRNLTSSSPYASSSTRGTQFSGHGDDNQVGTFYRHESHSKERYTMPSSDDEEKKGSAKRCSEAQDRNQHDAKRIARRQVWSLEVKKQHIQSRDVVEEPTLKIDPQSNGVISAVKSVEAESSAQQVNLVNDLCSRDREGLKGSECFFQGRAPDIDGNIYASIMKEDGRVANLRFGAARLWPLEAMLYMRFKRGPVSAENYERRRAQNEEFGIKDTFVRSSTGWWENHLDL